MKSSVFLCLNVLWASLAAGANLVPNGSFDESEGDHPAGWERLDGSLRQLLYATDNPRDGEHFLKFDTRQIEQPTRMRWRLSDPIPLEPDVEYRLDLYFRIDSSNLEGGQAVYAVGRYLDAEKKELPWREIGRVALHTGGWAGVSHGWIFRQVSFTVPRQAAFLEVSLAPAGRFRGVVAVDTVRIRHIYKADIELPSGALAFDFAETDTSPMPGFTAVPADQRYTAERGHGYDSSRRSSLVNVHNDNAYPNRLDATGVARGTFLCDLPNGRYLASLYTGGVWRTSVAAMNRVVLANGQEAVRDERPHDQLMDEEYFRFAKTTLVTADDLNRPGFAVWDKYLARRYRRYDFAFEVRKGRLKLQVVKGYANGLIIFPEAMKAEYQSTIDRFEVGRQREFVETWAELLREPEEHTDFRPTDDDRKRGYVVFSRHWMRRIQYAARPQPQEVKPTLRLLATPDEYEPVTFSIWPLRDLENVRIEVGPLENESGDALPPDAFQVWYHQHRQERRSKPSTAYTINAVYLPDWDSRKLYENITTRCWLNVKVPDDAAAGVYRGTVRVLPNEGNATAIPIELRVLPFKLVRKEALHTFRRAGNGVIVPYPSSYPVAPEDSRNKQFYRAQAIRDLYEHGFTPEYSVWWHGIWKKEGDQLVINWDRDDALAGRPGEYLRMIMELAPMVPKSLWVDAAAIGRRYIMPAYGGTPVDGITAGHIDSWLDELERKIPQLGVERLYVAPWGEESHFPPGRGFEEFLAFHRHVSKNRDRWPHIYTAHTCNTDWGQRQAVRAVDLTALGMFHGVRTSAREQVEMARQSGKQFGLYGMRGRWVIGFYFWRAGAFATYHEFYAPYWGTPNNDWDNPTGMDQNSDKVLNEAPGWCNATYSPDGRMIGSWFWEEMREGVDDHDYLYTLETLVERSADRPEPSVRDARKHAQRVLREVADAVDLNFDASRMQRLVYRPVSEEEHDALRRKVAFAAERLHRALGGLPPR